MFSARKWYRKQRIELRRLIRGRSGAAAFEWVLLLVAIAIPMFYVIVMALDLLTAHYEMITTLNGLPFP